MDNTLTINEILKLFKLNNYQLNELNYETINNAFINYLKSNKNKYTKKSQILLVDDLRKKLISYLNINQIDNNTNNEILKYEEPYNFKYSTKTYNLGYTSSKLNSIKRDIIETQLNIDSFFRESSFINSSFTNDFLFKLNKPLKNVLEYSIKSIELPNNWYNFSSLKQNNEFTINVYSYRDGTTSNFINSNNTIIIPDGNYSINELKNKINNYFNNYQNGLEFLYFDININTLKTIIRAKSIYDYDISGPKPYDISDPRSSLDLSFSVHFDLQNDIQIRLQQENLLNQYPDLISYDVITGNYIIDDSCMNILTENDIIILNRKIRDVRKNFGYLIGFEKTNYFIDGSNIKSSIDYTTDISNSVLYEGYLESESFYGNTIPNYIFLSLDDYNKNSLNGLNVSQYGNFSDNNVISKIIINNTNNSQTNLINNTDNCKLLGKRTFFGPVNINKFRVKLIDKFGELIDTKKNDFSITLKIKQIYS